MDFVIAKFNKREGARDQKHKLILTDTTLYEMPNNLDVATTYNAETLIEHTEWYKIENFSSTPYFLNFLSSTDDSVSFTNLPIADAGCISYICSCQNECTEFYIQKVSKSHLAARSAIQIGTSFEYKQSSRSISINNIANAIYLKTPNVLYFKKLETISTIFNGIDELYREATQEEVETFLNNDFIELQGDYSAQSVKKANRRRVALAVAALSSFDTYQRNAVFDNIKEYCDGLITENNTFTITSESDLELLSYGILQRFYTTADGRERRIANSVKSF
ncbi:MAG: hypothetical protein R3Y57_01835 [Erysipelotrichaceae bacterium]